MVPPGAPDDAQDVPSLSLSLSLIDCVPPGALGECMCSSSSVASDNSDGDTGLLSALLGPPSFGLAHHTSESSDLSYYSAIDSWPGPLRSALRDLSHVGVWLGRARSCRKFHHRVSRVSGMDAPSAVLLNDHRIKFSNLESMGCHCTTPGFWSGSAFRSRLVCWIRVLVRGCTRCPVSRPLTRPANFTEMCAL